MWVKAVVTICAVTLAVLIMLATGLQGGWTLVDTGFFVGLLLAFSSVVWWERHKGALDTNRLMHLAVEFAAVLTFVWIVNRIFDYSEGLGFVALAVLFLVLASWRGWRTKVDRERLHVADGSRR